MDGTLIKDTMNENKSIVQRLFNEVFNNKKDEVLEEIVSGTFVAHHPAFPEGIHGIKGLQNMVLDFRKGFPDIHYEIQDIVADGGDRVAVRWIATGTNTGKFLGMPASKRAVQITGTDIFKITDRKIAEAWVNSDFMTLFQQLHVIPTPNSFMSKFFFVLMKIFS